MTPGLVDGLAGLRHDTPGTAHRVHLNNAGSALMPTPVLAAVRDHLALEASIGGYEAESEAAASIEAAYRSLADLLSTTPEQVAICENATAGFAQALSSIPFRRDDVLLTTRHDYVSNQIQYLSLARRLGIRVERVPDAPEGGVDAEAATRMIHRLRPRLVAVSHVPTNSGLVQDVATIGRACRDRDVLYLVDACQSLGQIPLDPNAMGCDFLTATARKFLRGPRGVGLLWVSERILAAGLEPLFPDLRGADWIADDLYQPAPGAARFENWEFPWALVLGLGAAARYALDVGVEAGGGRAADLAAGLRRRLAAVAGVEVLDRGETLCAIVTVRLAGRDPRVVMRALRERSINTSTVERGSAVLDFGERGVEAALRLSPHYYNTEAEIDEAVGAISEIMAAPGT